MCGGRSRTPRPCATHAPVEEGQGQSGRFLLSFKLMIRALRRARLAPLAAAVALFATMPITVSSLLHDERDDVLCNPAVVVHDADAHSIGAAAAALPDSQHCVLCHALQLLRAVPDAVRFSAPAVDARLISGAPSAPLTAPVVSNRPARAPPSA
jgi:hypothetical protein